MGDIIDSISRGYSYVMDDLTDFRNKNLPLMSNPLYVLTILIVYLKFCTSIGPNYMKNRKPYKLTNIIMYYNLFQIIFSIFLTLIGIPYLISKDHSFICDPITNASNDIVNNTALGAWYYFIAKITELTETVFFVLRKKDRQVSTLHLYHHSMVLVFSWCSANFFPVGPIVLVGTMNSFVHVLMYTYYFLSGLGPQYQKYLWWKKHMTLIQLIQFGIAITHNIVALFHDCNYPKSVHLIIIANVSLLAYMFTRFYLNNYVKSEPKLGAKVNGTTKIQETVLTKRKSISVGQ